MSDTLFKIKQIVSLILFVAMLSLMGMITSRPIMILAYAGFFLAVIAIMYFLMRKRQRHFELVQSSSNLFNKIVGGVLLALALATPLLIAFRTSVIKLPAELSSGAAFGIVGGVSILFLALLFAAQYMINVKGKELPQRIIGYVLFVIAAALPGILMSRVDSSTSGIGSVYYVAMAVLILAFNGIGLITHQD
ncbi:MAG: hypothetical protein CVU50_04735 [Candidatus Cloacimonetes bacterium HGW-Cloacimonetes-3]|nr:MAG: hypothetical protein CVU50_04735 [Candidatus Cloacimonetes bacterium HGW-Cloacimonetes-3]